MKLKRAKRYIDCFQPICNALGVSLRVISLNLPRKKDPEYYSKSCYRAGKTPAIFIIISRIENTARLVECFVHELIHHIQYIRGLFPKAFKKNHGSSIRIEKHARKVTDKILWNMFGFHGSRLTKDIIKEYSK